MGILVDFFFVIKKKVFILMNTWIAEKDLMKHHCLKKKFLTANNT